MQPGLGDGREPVRTCVVCGLGHILRERREKIERMHRLTQIMAGSDVMTSRLKCHANIRMSGTKIAREMNKGWTIGPCAPTISKLERANGWLGLRDVVAAKLAGVSVPLVLRDIVDELGHPAPLSLLHDYLRVYRHLCGAADGARANEDVAGDTLPE